MLGTHMNKRSARGLWPQAAQFSEYEGFVPMHMAPRTINSGALAAAGLEQASAQSSMLAAGNNSFFLCKSARLAIGAGGSRAGGRG